MFCYGYVTVVYCGSILNLSHSGHLNSYQYESSDLLQLPVSLCPVLTTSVCGQLSCSFTNSSCQCFWCFRIVSYRRLIFISETLPLRYKRNNGFLRSSNADYRKSEKTYYIRSSTIQSRDPRGPPGLSIEDVYSICPVRSDKLQIPMSCVWR